jgi:hypothetical protein
MLVMMWGMKHRVLGLCLAVLAVLWVPAKTLAAPRDEDREIVDARLEGFGAADSSAQSVTLESGGTTLSWFMLVVLSGVCLGVLFMNAKRSHLD